jgi:uncharacterized repeat protein (TIGR01451 family)
MSGARTGIGRPTAIRFGLIALMVLAVVSPGTLRALAGPPAPSPESAPQDTVPAPDVSIVIASDRLDAVDSGDSITYTVTVTNLGNADAMAVGVSDQLSEGVSFAGATADCSGTGDQVTCALGNISPGASLSSGISVTVDKTFCGTIANAASVSASNEGAAAAGNNVSNDVTNTVECRRSPSSTLPLQPTHPDLQVTKSSDAQGPLHDGDAVLFAITVTNVGGSTAQGVRLIDVLPPEALHVGIPPFPTLLGKACTVTSSVPNPGGMPYAEVRCGPVALATGASATVMVKGIVSGAACGEVTNVVDVDAVNEPASNVGAENHAEVTDEIACVPRIRLHKGGPSRAHPGDTISYAFAVTNPGGVDLTGIDLSDPGCDAGSLRLVDHADGDDVLTAGEGWDFACEHTITAGDGDPVHNLATVTGHHGSRAVTDTDVHDVRLLHPSLELRTTASPTAGLAGSVVIYTYAVTNSGDTALFGVSVHDDVLGHPGTIRRLGVGQTIQLSSQTTLGSSPLTNTSTAQATDALGGVVRDVAVATVTVVAAEGGTDGTGDGSPFTGSHVAGLIQGIVVLTLLGGWMLFVSQAAAPTVDIQGKLRGRP